MWEDRRNGMGGESGEGKKTGETWTGGMSERGVKEGREKEWVNGTKKEEVEIRRERSRIKVVFWNVAGLVSKDRDFSKIIGK